VEAHSSKSDTGCPSWAANGCWLVSCTISKVPSHCSSRLTTVSASFTASITARCRHSCLLPGRQQPCRRTRHTAPPSRTYPRRSHDALLHVTSRRRHAWKRGTRIRQSPPESRSTVLGLAELAVHILYPCRPTRAGCKPRAPSIACLAETAAQCPDCGWHLLQVTTARDAVKASGGGWGLLLPALAACPDPTFLPPCMLPQDVASQLPTIAAGTLWPTYTTRATSCV
jgi:hypothetical protein